MELLSDPDRHRLEYRAHHFRLHPQDEESLAKNEPRLLAMVDYMDISQRHLLLKHLASHDNFTMFEKVLDEMDDADLSFEDNILLKIAVENDSLKILEYLLDHDVDPTTDNHFAIKIASAAATKILLDHGEDASADNDYAICYASYYGDLEKIRLLHQQGANIRARNDHVIRAASHFGYFKLVKYCIDAGANVNADNDFSLKSAVSIGEVDDVKLLLNAGANLEAITTVELISCIELGSYQKVKFLTELGMDFTTINQYPTYPEDNEKLEMICYLLDHGVDAGKLTLTIFAFKKQVLDMAC